MKEYTRIHDDKPKSFCLVLAVDNTFRDIDDLQSALHGLKKRFSIKPVLVFKSPELLFFNHDLLKLVSDGFFDRALVTDDPEFFWFDFLEFAKRQEVDQVFMAEISSFTQDWTSYLKFKVVLHSADYTCEHSICGKFSAITQKQLRQVVSHQVDNFNAIQKLLDGHLPQERKNKRSSEKSLFVTQEGLLRFGGINKFKNSSLLIGRLKPKEYKRIWVLNNNLDVNQYKKSSIKELRKNDVITIPGSLLNSLDKQVLMDINPAYNELYQHKEGSELVFSVPRTLLSITTTKDFPLTSSNYDVVFVMSNYNKSSYIPGALYSIVMQTHNKVAVHIVDDISDDNSSEIIEYFKKLLNKETFDIVLNENKRSVGTYWIRNSVIHRFIDTNTFYFVNDSDDYSSAQRAHMQLSVYENNEEIDICFGDIVRVDKDFRLLPLDGKAERYGTASLGSHVRTHKKYGYYENIRKNADTEFIERIKHFGGKSKVKWFRYPVLFQPFDGNNLTSDIYDLSSSNTITSDLSKREMHRELFRVNFFRVVGDLSQNYSFPNYTYTEEYKANLPEFLIQ